MNIKERRKDSDILEFNGLLNEILVRLFRDIMNIEEKAIITQEFKDLTNNDMHVIEAIGMNEPKNMTTIAREQSNQLARSCASRAYTER